MDDEELTEGFDRLVRLSGTPGPSLSDLEGRVLVRARRRRTRQRAVFGVCAALVILLGLTAVIVLPSDGPTKTHVTSKPKPTAVPVDDDADPVFTIARLPEELAFQSCGPVTAETDPNAVTGVTCMYDEPSTAAADGLRITRVGPANTELKAAWDAGDAPAAIRASGGSDLPDAARFWTLDGVKVLDLSIAGQPSDGESAALRVLVGDDLVDIGSTAVSLRDLGHVLTGLTFQAPSRVVSQALDALPNGSVALVQGERPLWVQPNPLKPDERTRFAGDTVGTEIAVPGSSTLVGVDVTTGIDANAFLDDLVAQGDTAFTETQVNGHRAVVLASGGMMPLTVPEPRPGPQVVVQLSDDVIVRVKDPDGDPTRVEAIAAAFD